MKRTSSRPTTGTDRPGTGAAARQAAPISKRKRRQRKADWIETLDAVHDRFHHIETLTGLLEHCGNEPLEPWLASGAGNLISRELEAVRELLENWHEKGDHL